jgi:hypothetical protein
MVSQELELAGKQRVRKVSSKVVEFPTVELYMQERTLGHIELVLSQLPMEELQEI